jgi:hypothetical protein
VKIYEYDNYKKTKRGYQYVSTGGALVAFGSWLKNTYTGPQDFDIGKALTG